jgi:hypothetical protein
MYDNISNSSPLGNESVVPLFFVFLLIIFFVVI